MPIYSFLCPNHGAFDLLLPMSEWMRETADCSTCGVKSERVAELCAVHPDANWHFGQVMPGVGEVNSKSKLARIRRERNIETISGQRDAEAMKKIAADARKNWDVQLERDTHKYFSEVLAGQGLVNSFGEPTADANRPQGNGDLKGEFKAEKLAS